MLATTITLVGASVVEPKLLLSSSVVVYFSNMVKRSDRFQGFSVYLPDRLHEREKKTVTPV